MRTERAYLPTAATIANGASLSTAVDISGGVIVGLILDSAWDTNIITFQVSLDGATFVNLYDDAGNEVQVPSTAAVASRAIANAGVLEKLAPWKHLKVRSGTSGSAANQTGATVVSLVVKG